MQPELTRTRSRLAATATLAVVGIATSASIDPTLGGWVTVSAVAMLIVTLHRFGRTGPA